MLQAKEIENKFVFKKDFQDKISSICDTEGQILRFNRQSNGNNIVFTKDLEGIEVAIEHCPDGTKIFHMEKDSKGLPAMHEFKPDGTEYIYLFDVNKVLEKVVELKTNGDKITYWFAKNGDEIVQEQRQEGGILFKMRTSFAEALIWLHQDGEAEVHGHPKIIEHLQKVFAQYLDGLVF